MGKIARLISDCFGRRKTVSVNQNGEPVREKRSRKRLPSVKRPPRFPRETRRERPATLRPKSPFDKRLKRLGQKIEAEVRKDYAPSQQSQLHDAACSECPSWSSSFLLNSGDSLRSNAESSRSVSTRPEASITFPSLEALEADCLKTLVEEQAAALGPVCYRPDSYTSSSGSYSPRNCRQHRYLFYEDDEDVVMEFLPTLPVIPQIC